MFRSVERFDCMPLPRQNVPVPCPPGDGLAGSQLPIQPVAVSQLSLRGTASLQRRLEPRDELFFVVRTQLVPAAHPVTTAGNRDQVAPIARRFHLLLETNGLLI